MDEGPGGFSVLSKTFRQTLLLDGGISRDKIGEPNTLFLAKLVAAGWAFDDDRGVWLTRLGIIELQKSVEAL